MELVSSSPKYETDMFTAARRHPAFPLNEFASLSRDSYEVKRNPSTSDAAHWSGRIHMGTSHVSLLPQQESCPYSELCTHSDSLPRKCHTVGFLFTKLRTHPDYGLNGRGINALQGQDFSLLHYVWGSPSLSNECKGFSRGKAPAE
jgi:hypothetical protein